MQHNRAIHATPPAQAVTYFNQAADLGDRNAHYYLAVMYLNGKVSVNFFS